MVVIAAVYGVMAWRDRSAFLAWWCVAFTAVYVASMVFGLDDPARLYALVRGGGLAFDGWRERHAAV